MSTSIRNAGGFTLTTTLILMLFLLAVIQSWYILTIKAQLNNQADQQVLAAALSTPADTAEAAPVKVEDNQQVSKTPDSDNTVKELPTETQQPAASQHESAQPDHPHMPRYDYPAYNPYQEFDRIRREMRRDFYNRLNQLNHYPEFNSPAFTQPGYSRPKTQKFHHEFSSTVSLPKIDIRENPEHYIVLVDLPGTNENDISVNLEGQRLSIKGKQNHEKQTTGASGNVVFREKRSGRFQRKIWLDKPVIQNSMKTRLDNGILSIQIKKKYPYE